MVLSWVHFDALKSLCDFLLLKFFTMLYKIDTWWCLPQLPSGCTLQYILLTVGRAHESSWNWTNSQQMGWTSSTGSGWSTWFIISSGRCLWYPSRISYSPRPWPVHKFFGMLYVFIATWWGSILSYFAAVFANSINLIYAFICSYFSSKGFS